MKPDALIRFKAKLAPQENGCLFFTGAKNQDGYGLAWDGERLRSAHILAYLETNGAIPAGLQLDHLCRNRACCNPAHLELVTARENTLRGNGRAAKNARKTHCARAGHPLSGENLRIYSDGRRGCVTCEKANRKAREQQNKRR